MTRDAPPEPAGDAVERLFWALMERFEVLALDRYVANVPALATPEKHAFVEAVAPLRCAEATLAEHGLAAPTDALLAAARSPDGAATTIVQGIVLERLGQTIYGIVAGPGGAASAESRALAARGAAASRSVTALVPAELRRHVDAAALWPEFAERSHDVLAALDGLAEPIDRVFGDRFGLAFADVMGEFAADVVGVCTDLGMARRRVVAHLAGAAMGL